MTGGVVMMTFAVSFPVRRQPTYTDLLAAFELDSQIPITTLDWRLS